MSDNKKNNNYLLSIYAYLLFVLLFIGLMLFSFWVDVLLIKKSILFITKYRTLLVIKYHTCLQILYYTF